MFVSHLCINVNCNKYVYLCVCVCDCMFVCLRLDCMFVCVCLRLCVCVCVSTARLYVCVCVCLQQALMSFEEEKLAEALKVLQETEKRCEVTDGFVKSFKRKFSKKKKTVC